MMKVLNPCAQNDMESTSSGSIASKTPSASKKLFVIKTMQEGRRPSQLGPSRI
ncbi:MAG: hypothetical protein IJG81_06530 [Muribaculaceae bacterium]|nr:hypothetical protein [Muribaculaceae bacterium]